MHVVVVPDCTRNWDCPHYTSSTLYKRFSPLYLPHNRERAFYSPRLFVADVMTRNASKRIRDKAKRGEALTFNVGFKYRSSNIIVCNKPVSDALDEVVTAEWVKQVMAMAARTPPSRISGLDVWGIVDEGSEYIPLMGKADWGALKRLTNRAMSRARKENWPPGRLIEYVEDGMKDDAVWPVELYAS